MSVKLPSAYVMDCSVTLSWFFPEERSPATEALLDAFPTSRVTVPELWLFELGNGLLLANRRDASVTESFITRFLDQILKKPITIDRTASDRAVSAIRHLAARHQLSIYDATYLDLAIRAGLPLATLDQKLIKATKAAGVDLVKLK